MLALSIVSPHGSNIATGRKTLEIRSWRPEHLPIHNLLIVENHTVLTPESSIDPNGKIVAIVDVEEVHPWEPSEVESACSSGWQPDHWAWTLTNIRPVTFKTSVAAERKLYKLFIDETQLQFVTT